MTVSNVDVYLLHHSCLLKISVGKHVHCALENKWRKINNIFLFRFGNVCFQVHRTVVVHQRRLLHSSLCARQLRSNQSEGFSHKAIDGVSLRWLWRFSPTAARALHTHERYRCGCRTCCNLETLPPRKHPVQHFVRLLCISSFESLLIPVLTPRLSK